MKYSFLVKGDHPSIDRLAQIALKLVTKIKGKSDK